jgi:Ca-activated chloride channel family protein
MIPDKDNAQVQTNDLDVLFVVDNTISMIAEDYNGSQTRLSGVQSDMQYILQKLSGAQFSLITFANTATIVAPFTYDHNMIEVATKAMAPLSSLYARGSSLNAPMDSINTIVTSAEKKEEERTRILVFISDGEITDDSTLKSYASLKEHFDYGLVLGYGTINGGKMKSNNTYSLDSYIKYYPTDYSADWTTSDHYAISKIDETNLKKIAEDIGGDYIHAESQKDIDPALKKISELTTSNTRSDDKPTGMDLYYIFAIPLLLLLFFEFNKLWRRKV